MFFFFFTSHTRIYGTGIPECHPLHHGPPPAYARGQAAVGRGGLGGGHPGILRGVRAAAGL